jgi:2-C-methyl-D-erythritol 2,4-cyclodiphosphate synthase
MGEIRIGQGFDLHPWDPGRPLLLAGVLFAGEPGLEGHSDGDAVCHAVADAMLGAAALGDIGMLFPDTDQMNAGIAGTDLLRRTASALRSAGFAPVSIDLTVLCDRPAISPRREEMRAALAAALELELGKVSVKATRPEGLGFTGDGVGCLALATVAESP